MRHRLIQRHTGETSHGRDRRKRTGLLKPGKAGSPGLDLGVLFICSNRYTTFTPFDGAQALQATERGLGIF